MRRFDTPIEVARELAKHVPRKLDTVLDPAVGAGALLTPLAGRFSQSHTQVFCVDSDLSALSELRAHEKFISSAQIKFINADFLEWSVNQTPSSFDCILMNPPFSGTKASLRKIVASRCFGDQVGMARYMPLEAAFICMSYRLLRDGGRLLAILPCSIIMAQSLQWLRDLLLKTGTIRSVHELPARCFPGVESRMYLLVFDKVARQRAIKLYNHDLSEPSRIDIFTNAAGSCDRLDFGYHYALRETRTLLLEDRFGWCPLRNVASVLRGDVASPISSLRVVHTSDYANGFWHQPSGNKLPKDRNDARFIVPGDVLVKRVGRNSYRSFGRYLAAPNIRCSDCVFIIRPKLRKNSDAMLFALKILSELSWTKSLLERGTGASYITRNSLYNLRVPMKLHERFPYEFDLFVKALRKGSKEKIIEPIKSVSQGIEQHTEM